MYVFFGERREELRPCIRELGLSTKLLEVGGVY